jgi:hypothetical protein
MKPWDKNNKQVVGGQAKIRFDLEKKICEKLLASSTNCLRLRSTHTGWPKNYFAFSHLLPSRLWFPGWREPVRLSNKQTNKKKSFITWIYFKIFSNITRAKHFWFLQHIACLALGHALWNWMQNMLVLTLNSQLKKKKKNSYSDIFNRKKEGCVLGPKNSLVIPIFSQYQYSS